MIYVSSQSLKGVELPDATHYDRPYYEAGIQEHQLNAAMLSTMKEDFDLRKVITCYKLVFEKIPLGFAGNKLEDPNDPLKKKMEIRFYGWVPVNFTVFYSDIEMVFEQKEA